MEVRLFINGEFVPSEDKRKFDVHSPYDGSLTASVYEAGLADVNKAVDAAEAAFPSWSRKSAFDRAAYFYKLADLLEGANGEMAKLEAKSMGKPVSKYTEGFGCARLLRYYAGKASDVQGESSLQTPGFVNITFRQPYGVCGAITPWNAPATMLMFKIAAAVICGNTLVAKSSEKAPLTALYIAKLIQQAGFPAGVVNILSGFGMPCGDAIARHMKIRKLSFTGSGGAGRAIKKAAAESNLKNVTLELGGKSPMIVFEDADLEQAAAAAAVSNLYNSGQVCTATTRLYVQRSVTAKFTQMLVSKIEEQGANPSSGNDPLSQATVRGPQADKAQYDSVIHFLDEARQAGQTFATGGARDGDKGYFIQPTLITEPADDSRVVKEEIFASVQTLNTFDTEEEVLRRANDTEFGLYASVWTKDISRSLRVATLFESGMVGVNVTSPFNTFDLPFGGWKASGEGVELSSHSLGTWTQLKSVFIKL